MAEEFNQDKLPPKEMAKHLRKPDGEEGIKIGKQMNKGNKHICLNSYKVIIPKDNQTILEIGMGNGLFVNDLLQMANNLNYIGLDYSATMVQEATLLNKKGIEENKIEFIEGSIEQLPFLDNSFDAITTTNTLYFWPNPTDNIKELHRVLKPNGKLLVAYRSKNCMDQIEVANYNFEKYLSKDVEALFLKGGFSNVETQTIAEPTLEFGGKEFPMEGIYTLGFKK